MEAIKKMERRLNQFTEDCLKELEFIDGLQIVSDNTSEEQVGINAIFICLKLLLCVVKGTFFVIVKNC